MNKIDPRFYVPSSKPAFTPEDHEVYDQLQTDAARRGFVLYKIHNIEMAGIRKACGAEPFDPNSKEYPMGRVARRLAFSGRSRRRKR